ncbi:MAG: hypothetical protein ACYC5J_05210 [Chloroflexota bacterium]
MEGEQGIRRLSRGKCSYCGAGYTRAGMTRHLESCKVRRAALEALAGPRKGRRTKMLHLVVAGRYLPEYWMHLEAPAGATLVDLDDFLRETWLECCGHLSAFTIDGRDYMSVLDEDFFFELDELDMEVALGKVLRLGTSFLHRYDFGTTTELALRVVSERMGHVEADLVRVLARNDPPETACDSCGKSAAWVCAQCIYDGVGWLCDDCAGKHECGEGMLLPVVNSPRVGMCGYTGPET